MEATMRIKHFVLVAALIVLAPRLAAAQTTFTVTNQTTQAYLFNGANPNETLTLSRGQTYTFNVTVTGHPFNIVTAPGLPLQDSTDPGIVGQGAQSATLTFTPSAQTMSTLFYQCGNHVAMTGQINIVSAAPTSVPATNRWALLGLAALVALAGGIALRRRWSAR
jgi:hypothetical protein